MPSLQEIIATSPVKVMPGRFCVMKCSDIPDIALCFAVMIDESEVTAIVQENRIDAISHEKVQKWFRLLQINVSAPFDAPGFLATAASTLAGLHINVFIVSTFSRDYILIRSDDLARSLAGLRAAGFPTDEVA